MSTTIILDTETTGLPPSEPIQVAWIPLPEEPGPGEVWPVNWWYRPSVPIGAGALGVHHITESWLARETERPSSKAADDLWRELPGNGYVVGHNVDYDWQVLGAPEGVRRICTLALSRYLWPDAENHKLATLCYHITPREDHDAVANLLREAHDARADVKAIQRFLLPAIIAKFRPETWAGLWGLSEMARVPRVMPFGKHRRLPIADVPRDYVVNYLLNLPDLDPYLRIALEAHHARP